MIYLRTCKKCGHEHGAEEFPDSLKKSKWETVCRLCLQKNNIEVPEKVVVRAVSAEKLKRNHISRESYYKILKKQRYRCAICKCPEDEFQLSLHVQNWKLKGLLCSRCITIVGILKEDKLLVKRLKTYIQKLTPSLSNSPHLKNIN